tara:strand:+ start:189 stop:1286 length:1098 start_codon:yes stop_codon:yes gene_type:complete
MEYTQSAQSGHASAAAEAQVERRCLMWIVPKNYQPSSVSALDTVASSEDLSLPGINIEQSLMSRSKPSPLRTWSQRWKRESWFRHLCGRILKPCQHTAFEKELMSSLAVIPANRLAPLGCAKAPKTQGTYGLTSMIMCEQLDLFAASSRTSKDTSALDSDRSSMIWRDLVIKRRGEYSARLRLAHLTNGNEFTFWPTPVAQDDNKSPEAHMQMKQRMKGGPRYKPTSLQVMVKGVERGLWPTPTAQDNNQVSGNPDHPKRGTTLGGAARLWPTPTASDSDGGPRQQDGKRGRALKDLPGQMWPTPTSRDWRSGKASENTHNRNSRPLNELIAKKEEVPGQLNPTWVEWLMGLPLGWTDLGSWGTE